MNLIVPFDTLIEMASLVVFRAKYLILSAFTCPETSVPFHLFRTLGLSDINENKT